MANRPVYDMPIGMPDFLATCHPAQAHLDDPSTGRAEMAGRRWRDLTEALEPSRP